MFVVFLSVCPSDGPSVYQPIWPFVHPSHPLSFCESICLSISQSVHQAFGLPKQRSVHPSIPPFVQRSVPLILLMSISLFVRLSIHSPPLPSGFLSVCFHISVLPSVYLSVHLFYICPPSISLFIGQSVCASVLTVLWSVCLSLRPSGRMSVYSYVGQSPQFCTVS